MYGILRNCQRYSNEAFQSNGLIGNQDSTKDNAPNVLVLGKNATYISNKLNFSNMFYLKGAQA
jgi:hypothetical protein